MYKGLRKQNGYKGKLLKEDQKERKMTQLTMKRAIFL